MATTVDNHLHQGHCERWQANLGNYPQRGKNSPDRIHTIENTISKKLQDTTHALNKRSKANNYQLSQQFDVKININTRLNFKINKTAKPKNYDRANSWIFRLFLQTRPVLHCLRDDAFGAWLKHTWLQTVRQFGTKLPPFGVLPNKSAAVTRWQCDSSCCLKSYL